MSDNGRRRRAVITGIGPITCIGEGKAAFWQGLRTEKSGIRQLKTFPLEDLKARSAGELVDFRPERYFPPHRLKRLDRYAQLAVASSKLALDDARLPNSPQNLNPRVGVSFGTALGGIANAEAEHHKLLTRGPRAVNPTLALQVFGGSAHSNIAIEFGFQGPGTTNSNSCASGTIAVGEALRYIREGCADVIIAGGAESPLSPLTYRAFATIGTMSELDPPSSCRPFDIDRDGFVMGEGAASLVIEELDHALQRGARIYAEVCGYGLTNDAFHMTTPRPDGSGATEAMRCALEDARIPLNQVDYINAHASSTGMNDANECRCIREVFGSEADRIPVSGTKAYTAHPLGATGAIEAAICAIAIDESWIPPTLHLGNLDPECDLPIVANQGISRPLRAVLSNSFGFGGINASIVLQRFTPDS